MEDLLKFLFIAGIIIVGIYKEVSKAKPKKASPKRPAPAVPSANPDKPLRPGTWGEPKHMDDFLQNITREPLDSTKENKKASTSKRNTPKRPETISDDLSQSVPEEEDFTIHSVEEARRAIIWGEILQRKY